MIKTGDKSKNTIVILSALYVTALFGMLKHQYGFHFFATDDFWMALIFSGRMTGTPEMMPMFGSWLSSFIITSLYKLNGNIGWYSWLFIFFMWLSATVICYCFLNETKKLPRYGIVIGLITFTLIFFSFLFYFSVNVTFSIVPVACGVVVILLTLSEKENITKSAKIFKTVLYIILMIAAMTIRKETSYTLLVVYLGSLFINIIAFEADLKESLQKALIIITIFGIILVTNTLFTEEEWSATIKTRNEPGTWLDHAHLPYEGNEELYESINWTEAEYNMAEVYMMLDEDFTDENFKILNNALEQKKETVFSNIKIALPIIFTQSGVDKYMVLAAAVLTITACVFCIFGENKRIIFAPLCYFAGFLVLFLYIVSLVRFLKHATSLVYIISLVPLCYSTVRIVVSNLNSPCKKWQKAVKYISLASVMLLLGFISYSELRTTADMANDLGRRLESDYLQKVDDYAVENSENVYFVLPLAMTYRNPEKLYTKDIQKPVNSICTVGWTTQTPVFEKQLKVNGIDKFTKETFFEDNVYIIHGKEFPVNTWDYYTELILNYVQDDYPTARIEIVSDENNFKVMKIMKE